MKKSLRIACLAAGAAVVASSVHAFEPTRPVEFVVTAGPGGELIFSRAQFSRSSASMS